MLDVSEPSFRIAAGLVALLAGAADVFRRPPAAEPALNGRRAALIPIAFPVVARPALLVLALGAGADLGVLACAGAMVAGVALLTALVARRPSDRAARRTARLLAVALVAGGAILALDGLLAV
jgi:small neutral amino acid transporter SnatA (MarC family)